MDFSIRIFSAFRRHMSKIKKAVLKRGVNKQPWEFHHESITLKELLGEGEFGQVRVAEVPINGVRKEVAVKMLKRTDTGIKKEKAKEKIKKMMNEARLMRHLDHGNVVKIYGVAVFREPLMILIELVKGGSLLDSLSTRRGYISDDEKIEKMSLGTSRGIAYLHSKGYIHRDIAARNCLYTSDQVAKISDFGMSRKGEIYKMKKGGRVPLKWTAPESMVTFEFSQKTDVFSYSILLWEIFTEGLEPYGSMTSSEVKKMITCGQRLEKPSDCVDPMYTLMEKCWSQNPANRPTMEEVVRYIENLIEVANALDFDEKREVDNQRDAVATKTAIDDESSHDSMQRHHSKRSRRHHKQRSHRSRSRERNRDDGYNESSTKTAVSSLPRKRKDGMAKNY